MLNSITTAIVRTITLILVGGFLGAVAAVAYAVLGSVIYWTITHTTASVVPLLVRFGGAGAIAGAIIGLCDAIDRIATDARSLEAPDECEKGNRIAPVGAWPKSSQRSRSHLLLSGTSQEDR